MSEDPRHRESRDNGRIDVRDLHQLRQWTKALGVTSVDLRMAIAQVGPSVAKVSEYFQKKRAL